MRNLLFLFFLLIRFSFTAQGNLQFNQVLILDGNTSTPTYTVPAGKVWKVESATISSINGYLALSINGSAASILQVVNGGNNLPYWIPAGTLVGFYIASVGKVSIIEFNVIP
jgi:hypothetical protein